MAGVITNPELPETDQTLVELQLSDLTSVENFPDLVRPLLQYRLLVTHRAGIPNDFHVAFICTRES